MPWNKWKIFGLVGIILTGLFYFPYLLSIVMNLCGLQNYWFLFWGVSYAAYAMTGVLCSRIIKKTEEPILAGISLFIFAINAAFSNGKVGIKYLIAHSVYGLFLIAVVMFVCRREDK